jgi:hypothetical protein
MGLAPDSTGITRTVNPTQKTLQAMEGCRMYHRRFAHTGHSSTRSSSVTLGLIASLLLFVASGCRTPWRSTGDQPDFDRLIEVERQKTGQTSTKRDPLAARHRPGSATRSQSSARGASSIEAEALDDSRDEDVQMAAVRQSSRDEVNDETEEGEAMEEMLVDVPPAQRDLLRREMTAMKARGAADLAVETTADDTSAAENSAASQLAQAQSPQSQSSRASRRITDDESTAGYVGNSKYQMAATASPQTDDGQVKPRAVERPYTRNFSDKPQPLPQSSRDRPLAELAPQKASNEASTEASPVVMASYNEKAPVDRAVTASTSDELSWREHLHQALAQLEQEPSAVSPEEQVHRAMVDRLLHLSLGDINSASEPIDGLQTHGQDFVRHSLESLYEVTNPSGNPVEIKRYSLAMLSQRKALSHLASVSNLEVHNATFCTEVDGYGVVTKFPQYAFKADQELLLYCELDNFVSSHIDGKGFETQLQGSYEIVDASGRRVADQLLPMDSHLCRNQRRDYFIAYRIYMPQKIDPGKYQLKLTVEDLKGRKFGQANLDFQISQ